MLRGGRLDEAAKAARGYHHFVNWGRIFSVADSSGFLYLAGLGAQNGVSFSHIGVARSTGTLPPFSFGTATLIAAPAGGALDKKFMAIDRTGGANNNRIYLTAPKPNTGRPLEAHSPPLKPPALTAWPRIPPEPRP